MTWNRLVHERSSCDDCCWMGLPCASTGNSDKQTLTEILLSVSTYTWHNYFPPMVMPTSSPMSASSTMWLFWHGAWKWKIRSSSVSMNSFSSSASEKWMTYGIHWLESGVKKPHQRLPFNHLLLCSKWAWWKIEEIPLDQRWGGVPQQVGPTLDTSTLHSSHFNSSFNSSFTTRPTSWSRNCGTRLCSIDRMWRAFHSTNWNGIILGYCCINNLNSREVW